MSEFGLSDAVSSFSHQSSVTATLWGIYVAATFAAAGFGFSLEDNFTYPLAAFLSVGFLSFTIGHLHLLMHSIRIQSHLRDEILAYLNEAPTAFAGSIRSICGNSSKLGPSVAAHIIIDICVLLLIWSRPLGLSSLN